MTTTMTPMCRKRLANELKRNKEDPLPNVDMYPEENNMLKWYFCVLGLESDTPYYGGAYVGSIIHSPKYPLEPPVSVMFMTPNGRFKINDKFCMDNTAFHRETWSQSWTMNTIILGIISIMNDPKENGYNFIVTSNDTKRDLAVKSHGYNIEHLPDIYREFRFLIVRRSRDACPVTITTNPIPRN